MDSARTSNPGITSTIQLNSPSHILKIFWRHLLRHLIKQLSLAGTVWWKKISSDTRSFVIWSLGFVTLHGAARPAETKNRSKNWRVIVSKYSILRSVFCISTSSKFRPQLTPERGKHRRGNHSDNGYQIYRWGSRIFWCIEHQIATKTFDVLKAITDWAHRAHGKALNSLCTWSIWRNDWL